MSCWFASGRLLLLLDVALSLLFDKECCWLLVLVVPWCHIVSLCLVPCWLLVVVSDLMFAVACWQLIVCCIIHCLLLLIPGH